MGFPAGETDVLRDELHALSIRLKGRDVRLIIGGGYGLLLRQQHVAKQGAPTLRPIPAARSTEDIDLFLSTELIVDEERFSVLRDALAEQGYRPVERAKYYQFDRTVDYFGQSRTVKIDLLAPLPLTEDSRIKKDSRRISHRAVKGIHAHTAPEALTLEEHLLPVEISRGQEPATVFLPHPYTFLVLKLHAYKDRREDEAKDFGRHHAFDLYRILAMTTESEWEEATGIRDRYRHLAPIQEACRIVGEFFGGEITPGTIALRGGAQRGGAELLGRDLVEFLRDLQELFPPVGE
ncbi:MAG: nucleotidyl transferase AbiEii/AbiGii toxin family protein [Rhodothermales bacterium]|nr:nucleotidyl transferase AbiEii/AbiGii toxin family protein [Rhodothermales bacterium]